MSTIARCAGCAQEYALDGWLCPPCTPHVPPRAVRVEVPARWEGSPHYAAALRHAELRNAVALALPLLRTGSVRHAVLLLEAAA